MLPVKIAATGVYLPEKIVTSAWLAETLHIDEQWILEKSGVKKRHWVTDETVALMGARALEKALQKTNIKFEELDAIICASGSYDYPVPSTACLIPAFLGKNQAGIPCWDIDATCLSFIVALDAISYLIAGGKYQYVAIISSEIASRTLNFNDKETTTLLGDAAVAVILSKTSAIEKSGILQSSVKTFSEGAMDTYVKGGGNAWHPRNPEAKDEDFTFQMNGRKLLKIASEKLLPFMEEIFEKAGFHWTELNMVIPHQASKLGLLMAQKQLKLSDNQFYKNLENYGNCIAASVPLALHEAIEVGKINRGDTICLLGTGAGFSIGANILVY
jgi:3-oxoacyl-[acyl-carrier-protein] synthase-3